MCEKIKCKNIIAPGGLQTIIKKPIFYKEYNIIIHLNNHSKRINDDILLRKKEAFFFKYRKKPHEYRLKIIREEVQDNIPKHNSNPNYLYIHTRSGDIFMNNKNKVYSQSPSCFYQQITNENNFSDIFIISNGQENPVIDKLIQLHPKT